jgi:integrase
VPKKLGKGIRVTPWGFQVYLRRHGQFHSVHYPRDTPIEDLPEHYRNLEARVQLGITAPADEHGTLTHDVREYLKAKTGMPTYADRQYRIELWRDVLGKRRSRDSITALEIRQQLESWRKAGKKPATLNTRRTALMDFFTVLNGPGGANPVKAVPKYWEEELPLDLPSLADAQKAIDATAHPKYIKQAGTATQARLRVLLWTGWPASTLKRLRASDIHWKAKTATVHGRKKGGGTRPRTIPLLPQAIDALRELVKLKGLGDFSNSSLHKAFQKGCRHAGVRPCSVYSLRHLFISTIVTHSKDERGAAELALHTSPQQTWRYSRHAASTRAAAALAETAKKLR